MISLLFPLVRASLAGRSSASLFLVFVFVGLLLRWRPALVRFDFRRGVFGVPMLAFL